MGWRAFSVAAPSVWNFADYLRDPALGLNSLGRQLKTFFLHYGHTVSNALEIV